MDKKDEKIELKDSERQPCEVWTTIDRFHLLTPVRKGNSTNASAL